MNKGIENLLQQTASINKQYKKIAEITGENYNVFRIINLGTSERRLHSAFLANLLNSKGSHGRGNVFVKEFINILKKKSLEIQLAKKEETEKVINFNANNSSTVIVEKWLGPKKDKVIDKDLTNDEGGYIDILLVESKQQIIIENKIYAKDQRKQILRYHNFDNNALIIYLTLDGKSPSDYSTSSGQDNYEIEIDESLKAEGYFEKAKRDRLLNQIICISYEYEILKWLEECKKYTVAHPLLRETITQYIYLIKYLTNQTTNKEMEKDIIQLMANKDNVEASMEIAKNIENMKNYLFNNFSEKLTETFEKSRKFPKWKMEYLCDKDLRWFIFRVDESQALDHVRVALPINYSGGGWIGIYNSEANAVNKAFYENKLSNYPIGKYEVKWLGGCIYIRQFDNLRFFFNSSECWSLIANCNFQNILDNIVEYANTMLLEITELNGNLHKE